MSIKKILIFILFITTQQNFSQFNELIFSKYFTQNESSLLWNSVLGLGDQNNDGYDDILIYECNRQTAGIYFGGSPMDTIPIVEISFAENITAYIGSLSLDINGDNYNDILFLYNTLEKSYVKGYYGGVLLDSIPDVILSPPQGSSGYFSSLHLLKDFDGDEYPEVVFGNIYLPFSNLQLGTLYFYKTYPELDTIPYAVLTGNSVTNYKLFITLESGDINGDGFTDFTTIGTENGVPNYRRNFYLGNANFDLTPAVMYKQAEHTFDLSRIWIIEDINKDGKADILTEDYDDTYPFWYNLAIWHGSFPIDTIPDEGINAQASTIVYEQLVCSPGDVNGDTFNDLLIGIGGPGGVFSRLWLGSRIMPDDPIKSWGGNGTYGNLLANIGDIDGDNVSDICVGNAGLSTSCSGFRTDFIYIFKGDTAVKIDTGTVSVEGTNILPEGYEINVFPNPFNPQTKVVYQFPTFSRISLRVYDILGNEITVLVNDDKPAGQYEIILDASKFSLSSGVYIIVMEALNEKNILQRLQRKVQLIK